MENKVDLNYLQFKTGLEWKIWNDEEANITIHSEQVEFSDWTGAFIIEIIDYSEYEDESLELPYNLCIKCVRLEKYIRNKKARECLLKNDFEPEDVEIRLKSKEWLGYIIDQLNIMGYTAIIVNTKAKNVEEGIINLIEKEKQSFSTVYGMLGWFLDMPQNSVGATGWNFMEGNHLGSIRQKLLKRHRVHNKKGGMNAKVV